MFMNNLKTYTKPPSQNEAYMMYRLNGMLLMFQTEEASQYH